MILRIINRMVINRMLEVRYVCEAMLNNLVYSERTTTTTGVVIKPTNIFVWCKVLEAIRKYIPEHDYKSCRDIFKMLLEVIKRIPHSNSSFPPPLETELFFLNKPSTRKRKLLLDDYNSFHDIYSLNNQACDDKDTGNKLSQPTDDLKLESLYEVHFSVYYSIWNPILIYQFLLDGEFFARRRKLFPPSLFGH